MIVAAVSEASGPSIPEQLGKHRIVAKLATGGMASVYLARLVGPANFENLVVLKRMLPHLAEDPKFREMFADEARTVARIRHPNVVRTFELVDERDELYLVMEYLEGETLQKLCRTLAVQKETLSIPLACHVVAEAAAGLHAAHELQGEEGENLGVVHRDVSPHNLFVGFDGSVKVIDFGIAKSLDQANQTSTGEVKGKFAYMSPEQVAGQATSRRTDVFALGVVLWEMLAFRRLFARENQLVTMRAVADEETPPPSHYVSTVPKALDEICSKCLAKRPEDRYASMLELRRDLLAYLRTTGAHDAQGEIASMMQTLFERSIAQRKELVRASRREDTRTGRMPSLEKGPAEEASGIPVSIDPVAPVPARQSALAPEAPTGRRVWIVGGTIAIAIALALVVGTALLSSGRSPGTTPAPSELAAAPEHPPAPQPSATPPEEPEPPPPTLASIALTIESDPPGALVAIDGIARGNAPLTVPIPTGAEPLSLELTLAGRRTTTTRFVPDHDQTLRIDLPRSGRASGASTSGTSGGSGQGPREGFFAFE